MFLSMELHQNEKVLIELPRIGTTRTSFGVVLLATLPVPPSHLLWKLRLKVTLEVPVNVAYRIDR